MKFDILKTRRGKLKAKLENYLLHTQINSLYIDDVLDMIDEYEKDNLETIEKLRKDKTIDTKRINGALKQSINTHGPVTKLLIGSATKRIYGALLYNAQKPRVKYTTFQVVRVVIEIILVATLTILIIK